MSEPRDGEIAVDCAKARAAYQAFKEREVKANQSLRDATITDAQRLRILGRGRGVQRDCANVTLRYLQTFAKICGVPWNSLVLQTPSGEENRPTGENAKSPTPKPDEGSSGGAPNREEGYNKRDKSERPIDAPPSEVEIVLRISRLLETSPAAVERLERSFKLSEPRAVLKAKASALATKLEQSEVKVVVEELGAAYDDLKSGSPEERTAAQVVKHVLGQIALLALDEDEVAQLRESELKAVSVFIKTPAASETFAEIYEARLGRRTPRFAKTADPDDWPRGRNAIPIPPETFSRAGGGFAEAFDAFMFDKYIKPIELRYSYPDRIGLANERHEAEMKRRGRRYCVVDVFQAQLLEGPDFDAVFEGLKTKWPSVAFLKLTPDAGRSKWESRLLWAVRDLLPDEA